MRAAEVEAQHFNFKAAAEFLDKAALRANDVRARGDIDVAWERLRLEGQRVHVPMYEAFASFMMNEHMQGQAFVPPIGPPGYQRLLTAVAKRRAPLV